MRIDVRKYLFMGASKDKNPFFVAAQKSGLIEFINPTGQKKQTQIPEVERLIAAIKIIRSYVHQEQEEKRDLEKALEIADQIVNLATSKSAIEQKIKEYDQEIEHILPFGEFSLKEIHKLEEEIGKKVRFFCAKSAKHMADIEPALVLVNQKDGIDYFIAIQSEPITSSNLEELYFEASLSELKELRQKQLSLLEKGEEELKALTRFDWLLHQALIHFVNNTSLQFAEESSEFELENQLFFVEGWVPKGHVTELQALCHAQNIYLEEVDLEKHDVVPTYLENKGAGKVGEDLIRIFDTPSSRDKDPSIWVLLSFAVFFSMIVYDAGYGLIFLAAALIMRLKGKNIGAQMKRFIALLTFLGGFCILWGGLTHSIFGIHLAPDNVIRKHSLMTWLVEKKAAYHMEKKDDVYQYYVKEYPSLAKCTSPEQFVYYSDPGNKQAKTPIADKFTGNILLELALFVGAIHICIGLLRYLRFNIAGLGWIAFIVGGYLYLPYYLHAASLIHFVFGIDPQSGAEFGMHLLIAGLAFTTIIGIVAHGIVGIIEPVHSIQIFADILSYLRLYALAYASYIVSETVNDLSLKLPLFFCILVIVMGHMLNITLAIILGAIHGLRLNFLEWYRYSFYGGGKEFRPLQLTTLD